MRRLLRSLGSIRRLSSFVVFWVLAVCGVHGQDTVLFASRSGWAVRYPVGWRVLSCRQCDDVRAAGVFVRFEAPGGRGGVMVSPLADQLAGVGVEAWLRDLSRAVNLTPVVREEWTVLGGVKALRVVHRALDSVESESVYVVRGGKSFELLGTPAGGDAVKRVLASFRFVAGR